MINPAQSVLSLYVDFSIYIFNQNRISLIVILVFHFFVFVKVLLVFLWISHAPGCVQVVHKRTKKFETKPSFVHKSHSKPTHDNFSKPSSRVGSCNSNYNSKTGQLLKIISKLWIWINYQSNSIHMTSITQLSRWVFPFLSSIKITKLECVLLKAKCEF